MVIGLRIPLLLDLHADRSAHLRILAINRISLHLGYETFEKLGLSIR
jgi:hypothetical protein